VFDNSLHRKHIGGIGATVFTDQIGQNYSYKSYGLTLAAAYNLRFDRWRNSFLSFGLQGGFIQKKIDFSGLTWGSQYNSLIVGFDNSTQPSLTNITPVSTYPVVNAGMCLYFNSLKIKQGPSAFVGLAISNLNRPNESLIQGGVSRIPFLMKVHGGVDLRVSNSLTIAPQFLWMQQNGMNQINVGSYISYNTDSKNDPFIATVGAWYRVNDSFIGLLGLSKSQYTIGFSYDLTSSSLHYYQGKGAFEISIAYRLAKVKKFRYNSTPLI
jgi:type IX secretion system PorP/SprF family membrane protein